MFNLDLKTLSLSILQIAEGKGISEDKVIEVIEMALAAAYKKEYGKKDEKYRSKFDKKNKQVDFYLVKKVVDEEMILKEPSEEEPSEEEKITKEELPEFKKIKFNPLRHIMIDEISNLREKDYEPKDDFNPGDEIEFLLEKPEKFGRIATQTAKQVLLQRIKEAERESVLSEFLEKKGEILSGIIQRREGNSVFVDIVKTVGLLPREEQVSGEFYKIGSRMRFYCLSVKDSPKGPEIILSRSHPKFLSKLFEIEVPEISAGSIEIKAVAREPGFRSKIAVFTKEEGVDPIGSCVGQRGTRVNAVMQEIGNEKIDIINWEKKPEKFIENALSPAKIVSVKIKESKAEVKVPEDQISLAIGKGGQNVKLASDLTGWKIDVRNVEERKK